MSALQSGPSVAFRAAEGFLQANAAWPYYTHLRAVIARNKQAIRDGTALKVAASASENRKITF